jgi:protein gp37
VKIPGEQMLLLDWIICGGESGPHARPMHPDWARSLRGQCERTNTAFFFKQWGAYWPGKLQHVDGSCESHERQGLVVNSMVQRG